MKRAPIVLQSCAWCGTGVEVPPDGDSRDAVFCPAHLVLAGRTPWYLGQKAIANAEWLHEMAASALLHWPWASLAALAGPLVPGRLTYFAAFPGNGKTTVVTQCIDAWLRAGKTITFMPLEADAGETITRVACYRAGVDADEALSMRLRMRADAGDRLAQQQIEDLTVCYRLMKEDTTLLNALRIEPSSMLTLKTFDKALRAAEAMESDVVIVDHVDNVEHDEREAGSEIQLSNKLQHLALEAAKGMGIPFVLATQLNSSRTSGDRLAHYRAPLVDWLYNKGKKEQLGATILGCYRPMNPDADEELVKSVRAGRAEPHSLLLQNRMAVALMKGRYAGSMKERSALLRYERGMISDIDGVDAFVDRSAQHGISTGLGASERGRRA